MYCNVFSRYSICRWMVPQSCSIVQYFVVNNHLVVSYPQQCHTGINVNHLIAIAFYIFSSKNLNSFQKRLIIIVIYNDKQTNLPHKQYYIKSHGIFTENFTIFFQVQEKLETCRNSNLSSSRRLLLGDDIMQYLYCYNQ